MKISVIAFLLLFSFCCYAQDELHIHHINIENGDATMIGLYNSQSKKYTTKVLIDGGYSAAKDMLLPYLKKVSSNSASATKFRYVVLTHYHNDHYIGLTALKTGKIVTDSIIDPGGYNYENIFNQQQTPAGTPPAEMKVASQWTAILATAAHHNPSYIKGHSTIFNSYGNVANTSLGKTVVLGNVNGKPVTLECVAGWGNSLAGNGSIIENPGPAKSNANNFSLAFILSWGEFRYFLGGDLGGETTAEYIDQETALSSYFSARYPLSYSYLKKTSQAGHICGFKANHHGSSHSNNLNFLKNMYPAIGITSAGDRANWHLPSVSFLKDLPKIVPLSVWAPSNSKNYSSGYYFTNLYNWGVNNSLDVAVAQFKNVKQTSFDYGNETGTKASYLIKVKSPDIAEKSSFEVYKVIGTTTASYLLLANYYCHSK
jgi:beta-lactamase superfamily II metal-dependent hydrolase